MSWAKRFAPIVIFLALDGLLIWYLLAQPLSFVSAVLLCVALTAALTTVVICFSHLVHSRWPGFGDAAQGLAAISAIVAFVVAANIYFLERKDKARLQFELTATRALIPADGSLGARVLLGVRILVTNNGSRQTVVRCITLDMFRPARGNPLVRNPRVPEEMMLEAFPERIALSRGFDPQCLRQEEARKRLTPNSLRPLYGWGPLLLEPSESDDRYFEMPVSCEYPFVRILVKIRLTPQDDLAYETKAIIPLREICEGHAEGMAASIAADGRPGVETPSRVAPVASAN